MVHWDGLLLPHVQLRTTHCNHRTRSVRRRHLRRFGIRDELATCRSLVCMGQQVKKLQQHKVTFPLHSENMDPNVRLDALVGSFLILFQSVETLLNNRPVYNIPPSGNVVWSFVFIVQVVRVFPYIKAEKWRSFTLTQQ